MFPALDAHGAARAAEGTAAVLLGHNHIHRYSEVFDRGCFSLDDAKNIETLKGLGVRAARYALPDARAAFLGTPVEPFEPYHQLKY